MMKRALLSFGLGAALCVIGAVAWCFFYDTIRERWHRCPLEAAAWAGQKALTNDIRIRMVDDLLRRHKFQGMTREEVTAVIGEPDKTEYFKDCDLVYWLGPERHFMSIDSEWLVFWLDDQKRVRDYRIVWD